MWIPVCNLVQKSVLTTSYDTAIAEFNSTWQLYLFHQFGVQWNQLNCGIGGRHLGNLLRISCWSNNFTNSIKHGVHCTAQLQCFMFMETFKFESWAWLTVSLKLHNPNNLKELSGVVFLVQARQVYQVNGWTSAFYATK